MSKRKFRYSGDRAVGGKNIRMLRDAAGLSQEELAKKIGVSRSAVALWETGRTMPSVFSLDDMSELFGVSDNVLLGGTALGFDNLLFCWKSKKPRKSGTYLAYVSYGNDQRFYLLLDYNKAEDKWEEKMATYINVDNGRRINSYSTFNGEVLQWTAFPECDLDEKGKGRK